MLSLINVLYYDAWYYAAFRIYAAASARHHFHVNFSRSAAVILQQVDSLPGSEQKPALMDNHSL